MKSVSKVCGWYQSEVVYNILLTAFAFILIEFYSCPWLYQTRLLTCNVYSVIFAYFANKTMLEHDVFCPNKAKIVANRRNQAFTNVISVVPLARAIARKG
jgi:hypothetical protein